MSIMIGSAKTILFIQFKLATAALDQTYMEKSKSKRKADYINDLLELTQIQAEKLTIKQLRTLLARYALS